MLRPLCVLLAAMTASVACSRRVIGQSFPPLEPGTRVRVTAPGSIVSGAVIRATADTVELDPGGGRPVILLPAVGTTRLERSLGPRTGGQGFWHGAGIGLLVGASAGFGIGLLSGDDPPGSLFAMSAAEKAMGLGMVFGGTGFLVGGVIGAGSPGERWEQMLPPSHAVVRPLWGGRLGIGVTVAF